MTIDKYTTREAYEDAYGDNPYQPREHWYGDQEFELAIDAQRAKGN